MATGFYVWSKTAASNSTADSTINWAEGQAPSTLNDSARAVMARLAEYRDDGSGSLTTGGTSTAYTLTTNQVFASLAVLNGAKISFVPHTNCGNTVTLAVDGLTAKPLRSAPGVELTTGLLVTGVPYTAFYNNSDGAFYIHGSPITLAGAITPTSVTCSGAVYGAGGVGYTTGSGGTVTQATNKTTGVTINKLCGQITTAAGSVTNAAVTTFTVTNSQVAAGDVILLEHQSGGTVGAYLLTANTVAGGSFKISMIVPSASFTPLNETLVISFSVIKAVTA